MVYITGGTSGLGLETARQLAALGAHIINFSTNAQVAAEVLPRIEAHRRSPGQRVGSFQASVADRAGILAAFTQAAEAFGPPDLVIHMAGIGGLPSPMADMPFEAFDRVLQTNLYGTRHVVEAALQTMRPGGRGRIVLAGSMGGYIPVYGYTAYGASKFAVAGFAQILRVELRPLGIDVISFCPGEVDTPMVEAEHKVVPGPTRLIKDLGGTLKVEPAVQALLRGIRKNRFLIIPGWRMKAMHWAFRLTPLSLWNAVTDRLVAHALRKGGQGCPDTPAGPQES
jgi:NAD(P)-dependent dehydrogenase (short-subunit alcohol dehydrogenase family)